MPLFSGAKGESLFDTILAINALTSAVMENHSISRKAISRLKAVKPAGCLKGKARSTGLDTDICEDYEKLIDSLRYMFPDVEEEKEDGRGCTIA